jgi:hypothetical protein
MCKPKQKVLRVMASVLSLLLLLGLGYIYQRSKFVHKANALFDPQGKAFHGLFLPWPLGRPTLAGGFDLEADRRVRAALNCKSGSISTNGMTLILHASAGTYLVYAN